MTDLADTDTATIAVTTIEFPLDRLAYAEAALAPLVRRCIKLGLAAPSIEVVKTFEKRFKQTVQTETGYAPFVWTETWVRAVVHGPEVKFGGWAFAAKIEHLGGGDVIARAPGHDDIDVSAFRGRGPVCDHCRHDRRRKETFVVVHDDGATRQIGRTCLADFLGHGSNAAIALRAAIPLELAGLFGDGEGGGLIRDRAPSVACFLSWVSRVEREIGFASRKTAEATGVSTTGCVASMMMTKFGLGSMTASEKSFVPQLSDLRRGARVRRWILRLESKPALSDYEANLLAVAKTDAVGSRHENLIASALVCYARDLQQKIKRRFERQNPKAASQHVGTIGKRQVFRGLTVNLVRHCQSDWGVSILYKLHDGSGNVISYFSSRELSITAGDEVRELQVGDVVDLKATPKKHDRYKDEAQTTVTRGVIQ